MNTILSKDEKNPLAQLALLRLAILYHKNKDYAKSLETFKRLLRSYPLTKLQEETKHALSKTLDDMLDKEMKMRESLSSLIHPTTKFVVSVPIGDLQDPYHTRSFSKKEFKKHLITLYGEPIEIDYSSGYSQVAWGFLNPEVFR